MNLQLYRWALLAASFAATLPASPTWAADGVADPDELVYPVVITPTRLRQSLADVPASVTVITAETIRRYGITSIPEALRLVPGMVVAQATGSDYRINYHGTNAISPRRLNVLVDGVSVYRPGFSRVLWTLLPVAMEDVDRIEVIRGPDSAAYGPNSMMAVVNILTKHPKDVEKGVVSVELGSHHTVDTTVRMATTVGSSSVRVTANSHRDSGYDRLALGDSRDSSSVKRLNVRALHEFDANTSLDVQAAYVWGDFDHGHIDQFQASYPDEALHDAKLSARWTKALSANHEVQVDVFRADGGVRQNWITCWPRGAFVPELTALVQAHPTLMPRITHLIRENRVAELTALINGDLTPLGADLAQDPQLPGRLNAVITALLALGPAALAPACGALDQNGRESRTQLEVQDTYVVSPALRFVGGLGVRYQEAASQTYFGGKVDNNLRWLFGHAEYRPIDWLTVNVGGYGESNSLSGKTFSPRLALNAKASESQTWRAVWSEGTRTPDLFEERANWSYTFTGLSPAVNNTSTERVFATATAASDLTSERTRSMELGYLLTLLRIGLTLDVRVFDEHLTSLLSDHLSLTDFEPSNSDSVRLTGAEMQLNWAFATGWSALFNHAYLLNRNATSAFESAQYSRHSGAVGLAHEWAGNWRAALSYYASTGDGVNETSHGRTDLNLAHGFRIGSQAGLVSVRLSYLSNPTVQTFQDANRVYRSTYDDRLGVYAQLRLAY